MDTSLDQFINNLVESRLLSAAEIAAFRRQLPADQRPSDAAGLAREMVRLEVLTTYQAAAAYQGRTKELVFGPYVVLDKVGAGKMGFVYKVQHRELGQVFAIKVLPARRVAETPKALARFEREVALHVRLHHPNIVRVHDAGQAWGLPFLVMEYVEGQDLEELVKDHGPLPPDLAVECVRQVAAGMAYAHREGIVHRDIKPANLVLDKNGTVKILDLGLGRFDEQVLGEDAEGGRLTSDMQILGTPNYMAPEQAKNPRGADARCDIYSLGCTLFYLLTGRAPFQADTPIRTLLAHRESPVPSLRAERGDVPEALDSVFARMLAKTPEQRLQSMDEVIAALAAPAPPAELFTTMDETVDSPLPIQQASLIPTARPLIQTARPPAMPRRTTVIVGSIVAAVAVLAALIFWLLTRP